MLSCKCSEQSEDIYPERVQMSNPSKWSRQSESDSADVDVAVSTDHNGELRTEFLVFNKDS